MASALHTGRVCDSGLPGCTAKNRYRHQRILSLGENSSIECAGASPHFLLKHRYGFSQTKAQTSAHEHHPYGQRYSSSGPAPYQEFTGKSWDDTSRAYYVPYRHYLPGMNRWTTPDPAGLLDGPNVYAYDAYSGREHFGNPV